MIGISEATYSRYAPTVGDSVTWSGPTTENAIQFSKHIIPSQNDTYDIGGTGGSRWNALYVKEIFVSGDSVIAGPVKAISVGGDGNLAMPSGAKIGGVNPGTIVVKVRKKVTNLPNQGLTGDGYIVGGDLYVAADNNNPTTWTNVGAIRGPQGAKGFQGFTGFQDILDFKDLLVIPVSKDLPVNKDSLVTDLREILVILVSKDSLVNKDLQVTSSGLYWLYRIPRIYRIPGIYWIPGLKG